MKTIVVGYADERGLTPAKLIAGPDVSASDQIKAFNRGKVENTYPEGIVRMELATYQPRTVAIKIVSQPAPDQAKPETKKGK